MTDEDDLMAGEEDVNQDSMADEWAAAMAEAGEGGSDDPMEDANSVDLEEFQPTPAVSMGEGNPDLETILGRKIPEVAQDEVSKYSNQLSSVILKLFQQQWYYHQIISRPSCLVTIFFQDLLNIPPLLHSQPCIPHLQWFYQHSDDPPDA